MEMEGEGASSFSSPFKGVSKAMIKAELRASQRKLSAHGLMHGAKWAAEQIIGLGAVDEAETQVGAQTHPACPDDCECVRRVARHPGGDWAQRFPRKHCCIAS